MACFRAKLAQLDRFSAACLGKREIGAGDISTCSWVRIPPRPPQKLKINLQTQREGLYPLRKGASLENAKISYHV
jgi:hypothetical protein